jgi:hypothetical protein
MSVRCCCANGNLTAAATWALIDPTSYLDVQVGNNSPSTTYLPSQPFTPGAITIDALLVKLYGRSNSPGSNTFSVRLAQAGVLVNGTEVVTNDSDVPYCTGATSTTTTTGAGGGGWVIVKLPAPVTLAAATAYTLDIKCSNTSLLVAFYRDATTNNWSRALRTTTTGAPAAGDDMIIGAEYAGPGVVTPRTVNMDSTTATDYGSANTSQLTAAMAIVKGGTLSFDPSLNTILQLSGNLTVHSGGTLAIGTVATPIPTGKTATLIMDCASIGQFGVSIKDGGIATIQGSPRTAGKPVTWCKLASNLAVAGTSVNIAQDTGWLSGDEVYFSSTSRTYTEVERLTLTANASLSSLSVTAAAFAHSGTGLALGEVALLTRNVTIKGQSATLATWFYVGASFSSGLPCNVDIDWAAFRFCCSCNNTTICGMGLGLDTNWSTVTFTVNYCSYYDSGNGNSHLSISSSLNNNPGGTVTINDNVFHVNTGSVPVAVGIYSQGGPVSFQRNCVVCPSSSGSGVTLDIASLSAQVANNVVSSVGGVNAGWSDQSANFVYDGSAYHDNEAHSCKGAGFYLFQTLGNGSNFTNYKSWRNNANGSASSDAGGIYISSSVSGGGKVTLKNAVLFGNAASNIFFSGTGSLCLEGGQMGGDTVFAPANNVCYSGNTSSYYPGTFNNVIFSKPGGGFTAVTGSDIAVALNSSSTSFFQLLCDNCWFSGSGGVVTWGAYMATFQEAQSRIFVKSQYQNGGADNNFCFTPLGNIGSNITTFHGDAGPSEVLNPKSATLKLQSGPQLAVCKAGDSLGISCYARKDVNFAGTARLILLKQDSMGVLADQVLDTISVGADTWELLSGIAPPAPRDGVYAFLVDCDGTTGAFYVDEWQAG